MLSLEHAADFAAAVLIIGARLEVEWDRARRRRRRARRRRHVRG